MTLTFSYTNKRYICFWLGLFFMALSSIFDDLRKFIIEEKNWNQGAIKCLNVLM